VKKHRLLAMSFCFVSALSAIVSEVSGASLDRPVGGNASGAAAPKQGAVAEPVACSVEELYKRGAGLDKKEVVVHGRAVKVTSGIMGKTWTHIQDGTGDKGKGTHDVISISAVPGGVVGDVVTVKGTVAFHTEGRYRLVIEDATFVR
jgi:hypothetical protein